MVFWVLLCVTCGILANLYGNECMHARIAHTVVLHLLSKEPPQISTSEVYRRKLECMLNISVVSFYTKIGLICKGSVDLATKGVDNWPVATFDHPLSFDASVHKNPSEYLHKTYAISPETSPWRTLYCRWQCGISSFVFTQLSPNVRQKNLVKPTRKTDFSLKLHLKVIQGQAFCSHRIASLHVMKCLIKHFMTPRNNIGHNSKGSEDMVAENRNY